MISESGDGDLEEESPSNAGAPSGVRGGVWSVVERVIGSFVSGGSTGSGHDQDPSRPVPDSDGSEQDRIEHRSIQRPPTDTELRARMARSSSSKLGSKHTTGAVSRFAGVSRPDTLGNPLDLESAPTTEQATANVPISLTPMQPPPDVLAVMKGRAAVGQRRPRFSAPPADVAIVLDKAREQKKRGHTGVHHRACLGEDEEGEGGNHGSTGDSAEYM